MAQSRIFDSATADLLKSIRLEASAGTGKTYNLERVVCELIGRYGLPIESILVVTFTNKAARELKERIRSIITEKATDESDQDYRDKMVRAKRDFDKASIHTIHGFCQHVLQTYPFESSSPFSQDFSNDLSLAEEAADHVLYGRYKDIPQDERELVKAFFKDGLEEGARSLAQDLAAAGEDDGRQIIPDTGETARLQEEYRLFREGKGRIREALKDCLALSPAVETIQSAFKWFGTGQTAGTAKKVRAFWDDYQDAQDLDTFLEIFSERGGTGTALSHIRTDNLLGKFRDKYPGEDLPAPPEGELGELITHCDALFDSLFPLVEVTSSSSSPLKNRGPAFQAYLYRKSLIDEARPVLEERKTLKGVRDFSDLINVLHRLLEQDADGPLAQVLRSRYRTVLVDEFQDTDTRQWSIFSTLFGQDEEHNYFLIGDPKQSIYGFRGADLNVYFQACDTVEEDQRYSLAVNYRSRPEMVRACNRVFSRLFALDTPGFRPVPFEEVGAGKKDAPQPCSPEGEILSPLRICEVHGEDGKDISGVDNLKKSWMDRICRETVSLLSGDAVLTGEQTSRSIKPGDIAVLMDTHRDCEALLNRLSALGIPGVIYSERKIMETEEALYFASFLQALAHPGSWSAAASLLLSPVFELSTGELQKLRESEGSDGFLLYLQQAREICDRGGLIRVFRSLFEEELPLPFARGKAAWRNRLLRDAEGKRKITNLLHLAEIYHNEQRRRGLDALELYDLFLSKMNHPEADEEGQVRLDQDDQAVQIMTHHASKGLEFPVVFFSGGMKDGTSRKPGILDYSWDGKRYKDYLALESSVKKNALSDWEERKRLYYVSFTRASALLYLPWFPGIDVCYLSTIYASLWGEDLIEEDDSLLSSTFQDMWPIHLNIAFRGGAKKDLLKKKRAFNDRLTERIKDLCRSESDLFSYGEVGKDIGDFSSVQTGKDVPLALPELHGTPLFKSRIDRVFSFSSLTENIGTCHSSDPVPDDADRDAQAAVADESREEELSGALGLTRGSIFGNLVHTVFEEMDYAMARQPLEDWFAEDLFERSPALLFLEEQTLRYFDENWWKEHGKVFCTMIYDVLNCPLPGVGPLKSLKDRQRKHELEFLMPLEKGRTMSLLDWKAVLDTGYLKGFIDLIFECDGKLYIADWKTTVPAGAGVPADYDPEKLDLCMKEHRYDLQAMIYVYALRRYMLSIDPEFSFDEQFGGVFYFFVRGMGKDGARGVHFFRPREQEVLDLLKEKST